MKARKYCWLNSALKEVNYHEDETVARNGAIASVVDVVKVCPKLHDKGKRTETPVHCLKLNFYLKLREMFEKLTLRVAVKELSVSDANAVVVVQVDFDLICRIAETKNWNFRIDQREVLEWTCQKATVKLLSNSKGDKTYSASFEGNF